MKIFEQKHTVACFETDQRKSLRPRAFMDWAQEIAQLHAEQLHFGYDDFIEKNLAWVVTRFYARFDDSPRWKDNVVLRTWHKGHERIMSIRDFQVIKEDGTVAVSATSSWVIVNLQTRQFSREHLRIQGDDTICTDSAVGHSAEKLSFPKGAEPEFVGDHIVSYSDIDMNGHTNNASYIAWTMDAIGYETARSRDLLDFTVNFNHESVAGDCVSIYMCRKENEFFVEGRIGDISVFVAQVRFKD